MVKVNLARKNIETPTIHTLKMVKRLSLAEVISEVSEKVQDRSDEESSEDEGDGINGYLGALFFYWGAVEFLEAVAIQSTYENSLADGDRSLSDGMARLEMFLRFVLESSGSISLFGDQDDKLFLEKWQSKK